MTRQEAYHGHGKAEPIGLEYLAASLRREGFACEIRSPHELRCHHGALALSLLSGVTCEWPAVERAAVAAKRDGCITAVGGYHVSGRPDGVYNGAFDFVVLGEGEEVSVALARAYLRGEAAELPLPRTFVERGPHVLKAPLIRDLDALALPERSEDRLSGYVTHDLMWPHRSQQRKVAVALASRGCFYDCDFCASSAVWGRGPRLRSPGSIVAELQNLKRQFGTNMIVIIDQSFGQVKQWTLDVCEAIRAARLGMNWYHQSNLTVDREVLRAMAEAGCTKIGFGLEGISTRAIERIKPPNPNDFRVVNDIFDFCNSLGMFVKSYLMIGFPWETEETVAEYLDCIRCLRGNQIKISYMTPFPGTAYWKQYSGQLVSRDWSDFDTVSMPVVYNPNINVERYHAVRQELFHAYYGSPTYAEVTRQMLRAFPHYRQSYWEFAAYLQAHGMVTGEEVWLDWIGPEESPAGIVLPRPAGGAPPCR